MGRKMTRKAYEELIQKDINWLSKETANTNEREHILKVLEWAVRYEYDFIEPSAPNEEG